jgi:uncharacterized protein (TIGR02145 family)
MLNIKKMGILTTMIWMLFVSFQGQPFADTSSCTSTPGAVQLTAPSGTITDRTPALTWTVNDCSTWYQLYLINTDDQYKLVQWYEIEDNFPNYPETACSQTACEINLPESLPFGDYQWWIRTWNDHGNGDWSGMGTFTIASVIPDKIIPIAPSGTVNELFNSFDWEKDEAATWYKIFIQNSDQSYKFTQWYEIEDNSNNFPEASCAEQICSVSLNDELAEGDYTWWVRGWNEAGNGPWSDGIDFTFLKITETPSKIILTGPSETISGTGSIFTWQPDTQASWYKIFIQNLNRSYKFTEWYEIKDNSVNFPEISCDGESCFVILDDILAEGSYTWWAMGWNEAGNGEWSDGMDFTVEDAVFLTDDVPDYTVPSGSETRIYGSEASNQITLESGAKAELIDFPGQNAILIQSSSTLFSVSSSNNVAIFNGSDGTVLTIPVTQSVQTITFTDKTMVLNIHEDQAMLDDYVLGETPIGFNPSSISCGAYVAPGVWKEFDCYNLAAIGKITGDDPFTPSWRLIGGYWQWGRKGPDPDEIDWYNTNTEHFAHGPTGPGDSDANSGSISGWDGRYAPNGAWSESQKTDNDPCPDGFRVPTKSQWDGVRNNNTQSIVGTWSDSATNYSSARMFGDALMLPAAGSHDINGALDDRGISGRYWSSSHNSSGYAWYLSLGSENAGTSNFLRRFGYSVRCVAEKSADELYTISYSAGPGGSISGSISQTVTSGEDGSEVSAQPDTGYNFVQWSDGSTANPRTDTNVTVDVDVTAQFAVNQYTVIFEDYDGTELKAEMVNHGEGAVAPDNPVREGYTFTGWDVDFDTVTSDLTVTAQYSVNQYTMSFNSDGETEVADITQDFGTAVIAPDDPVKTGHSFMGWTPQVPATMPFENITLTAQWTINTYTVTFIDHDGTVLEIDTVAHGDSATAPAYPTREGHTFTGWDKAFDNITGDLTVTVQYDAKQYTITFNSEGGSPIESITQDFGTAVIAPDDPVKTGHSFIGWTPQVPATMPFENITVTAQWKINTYTVKFLDHDGTVIKSETVVHGGSITPPNDPTREGYIFIRWAPTVPNNFTEEYVTTAIYKLLDAPGPCGAYVATGVWKEFDCYNLAAIGKTTNDDPLTPSWRLIGGYWQWGRKGPDPSNWYDTNTKHFAHGPTGPSDSESNSGSISNWDTSYAPDGAWSDNEKTDNDPCPDGFRIPTQSQWQGVSDNNIQSRVGTWPSNATNYTSALFIGKKMLLPVAGARNFSSGSLGTRGLRGYYWGSSQLSDKPGALYNAWNLSVSTDRVEMVEFTRSVGSSLRCISDSEDPTCAYWISSSSGGFGSSGGSQAVSVTTSYSSCSWTTSNSLSWVSLSPADGTGNGSVDIEVEANTTGEPRSGSITIADQMYTVTQAGASSISSCGAYVAPGVWKEFDCYNLAAIGKTTNDDPFTPSWRLIGGYWQWGRKGPDPSNWYDTNTEHFAHGPTGPDSADANSGSITSWDSSYAIDSAWTDNEKTTNDPCPEEYRVPTDRQWTGVFLWTHGENNLSMEGTWSSNATNYTSALFVGDKLMLPAAGYRYSSNYSKGTLESCGYSGNYWSSSPSPFSNDSAAALTFYDGRTSSFGPTSTNRKLYGYSVRCIREKIFPCSFKISSDSGTFASIKNLQQIFITAPDRSCEWSTSNNLPWVSLSPSGGTGSGSVNVEVNANTGGARSGSVTIAGETYIISQEAAPCTNKISSSSGGFGSSGGSQAVSVTTSYSSCSWTTSNSLSWVSLSPADGTGNGSVDIEVEANTTGEPRSGSITIADQMYTVTQAGASSISSCGAYVAPGVWKEFDCYNLAAIGKTTNDDPFTPSWRLIGGYWQWGRKGPDPSNWYDTNTEHFAHGPTGPDSADANSGSISGRDQTYAPDGSWSDATKTTNDPCPPGYRVPTKAQWIGILSNNTHSILGTWSNSATNYSAARFIGNKLMLPAAGTKVPDLWVYDPSKFKLISRGSIGFYWSSSQGTGNAAWEIFFSSPYSEGNSADDRRKAQSVRCISEAPAYAPGNVNLPQSSNYTYSNLFLTNPDNDTIALNTDDGTFKKTVSEKTDQVDFMILSDKADNPVLLSIDLETKDPDISPATTALALVMTDPVLAFNSKQLAGEIIDEIKLLPGISLLENYIFQKISENQALIIDPDDETLLQYIYAARNEAIEHLGLDLESIFVQGSRTEMSTLMIAGSQPMSYNLSYRQSLNTSCEDGFRLNPITQNGVDSGVTFEVVDCSNKSAVKLKAINRFSRYTSIYKKTDDILENYNVGEFLVNVGSPPTIASLSGLNQLIKGNALSSSKEFVLDFTSNDSYTVSVVGPSVLSFINDFPDNAAICWPSYWRTALINIVAPSITIISKSEISEFVTHAEKYMEDLKNAASFPLLIYDMRNADSGQEALFLLGNFLMHFLLEPEDDNPQTNMLLRIIREIKSKSAVGQRTKWEKTFINFGNILKKINFVKKYTDSGWKLSGTLTSLTKVSGLGIWSTYDKSYCHYTIVPEGGEFPPNGGHAFVSVATSNSSCDWTTSSSLSWVSISPWDSGTGSQEIAIWVSANTTGTTRSGSITIAGKTYNISQAAATCTYQISSSSGNFLSSGESKPVSVTTSNSNCSWNTSNNLSWVSLSPTSGIGSKSVNIMVSANTTGTTRSGSITIAGKTYNISQEKADNDPPKCGAFIAPGTWKKFDCYNLAAIGKTTKDDPFTPSWRLIGGYWQWGRKGPSSSQWYDTNTEHFAHGPIGPGDSQANSGEINDWEKESYAKNGDWYDPCPDGFKVPTKDEWDDVLKYNEQAFVGSWDSRATNYEAGLKLGKALFLPAAGLRLPDGALGSRGVSGHYWSSSESSSGFAYYLQVMNGRAITLTLYKTAGLPVRCISEE